MKHGQPFTFLAALFNIQRTTATWISKSVLQHPYDATRGWLFWPSRTAVQSTMPPSFRALCPGWRVIIDCTELRTEVPPSVECQNMWHSNYKSTHTVKYLIGISPSGLITLLSKGCGGRASDTIMTTYSKFLSLLDPGDVVLAGKGFPGIRTGVVARKATLVMPLFPSGAQFTDSEVEATYQTASVRIHVERVIQRVKIFSIVTQRIPYELTPCLDQIMHVLCVLTNLKPGIFSK